MDTSEVISVDPKGSTPGSKSTHKIHNQQCIVRINSSTVMSIGGYHGKVLRETWYSHVTNESPSTWNWFPNNGGPKLQYARKQHGCVAWNFKGQTYIMAIAGQFYKSSEMAGTNNVYYLTLGTNRWKYGKSLLYFVKV